MKKKYIWAKEVIFFKNYESVLIRVVLNDNNTLYE